MSNDTTDRQDPTARRRRAAMYIAMYIAGLVVAVFILNRFSPAPQHAAPAWPEPQSITIDNSSEVHIMSDWCIGLCAK